MIGTKKKLKAPFPQFLYVTTFRRIIAICCKCQSLHSLEVISELEGRKDIIMISIFLSDTPCNNLPIQPGVS